MIDRDLFSDPRFRRLEHDASAGVWSIDYVGPAGVLTVRDRWLDRLLATVKRRLLALEPE